MTTPPIPFHSHPVSHGGGIRINPLRLFWALLTGGRR